MMFSSPEFPSLCKGTRDDRSINRSLPKGARPRPVRIPAEQGKTTLARLLANYAVRMGERPVYVDLDVTNGAEGHPESPLGLGHFRRMVGPGRLAGCR